MSAKPSARSWPTSRTRGTACSSGCSPTASPTPSNLRYRRARRQLEAFIYGIIEERRRSGRDTGDLLSMLLHATDEDGARMSDEQLRDEVMTVIMAGHETTAIALSWTWRLLALHPEVEKKLHAELDEQLNDAPTVDDLPHLPYTDAVLKESMRLFPPAWAIGREAIEDCEIGGYHVPAKTQLFISQYVVHHDPSLFEDPDTFDPDRWTNGLEKKLPKYAYFPFGGGPRLCVGQSFAKMEAALLLATTAQKFRMTLSGDGRTTPQPLHHPPPEKRGPGSPRRALTRGRRPTGLHQKNHYPVRGLKIGGRGIH